jgi:hypothetical protein
VLLRALEFLENNSFSKVVIPEQSRQDSLHSSKLRFAWALPIVKCKRTNGWHTCSHPS